MSDYADYRVTQARLDRVRQRAARQKRVALFALVVLAALVFVFAVASSWRGEKVAPPNIVLTWPSPQKYGHRLFSGKVDDVGQVNLGEILMRRGQPFSVAVQNGASWDATFVSTATSSQGEKARWQPTKDGDTLKIFVRKKVSGWRKLFGWTQPKQELRFVARDAKTLDANRRELASKNWVWLSQSVVLVKDTQLWDQRAIPLLESVANREVPAWRVASAFINARTISDKGSYFEWRGREMTEREMIEPENVPIAMTNIARKIAVRAPQASIKWIVNGGTGTLRLEFDGSGAHGGWVKNAGETQATPLRWWDANLGESEIRERVAPSLPR